MTEFPGACDEAVHSMADNTKQNETRLFMENERLRARVEELESRGAADGFDAIVMPHLIKSCRAILSGGSFEVIARSLYDCCKSIIGARAGYVALLSPDGTANDVLFLDSGGASCSVDPDLPMPIRGLRSKVYESGKAVYENDFMNSDWVRYMPEGHAALENVLFAPLTLEGKTVGLFGLANKSGGFGDRDAMIATAFGDFAAVALMNSRTMESFKNSVQRFRSVTMTALDAIVSTDGNLDVISWNKGAEYIFGYGQSEIVGRPFSDLLPPDDTGERFIGPESLAIPRDSHGLPQTVELRMVKKDGSIVPTEMSFSSWQIGEDRFLTFIIRDITERKAAEEALRKAHDELEIRVRERTEELSKANEELTQEIGQRRKAEEDVRQQIEFLRNIVDSLAHPFYVIDTADYSVILANAACGLTLNKGKTTCYTHFFGRSEPCAGFETPCPLAESKKNGEAVVVERVRADVNGSNRYFEVHGHPIFGGDGTVVQFIEYMIDITERKRAEREFAEAEKIIGRSSRLASIGVMTAGINHEINQPLTAIKFHVDGLLYWEKNNPGVIPEMIVESLRDISDGVRRIDEIIKHMRSFWKTSDRAGMQVFGLNETIEKALSLLDRQLFFHGVRVVAELDESNASLLGHPLHVEQIVINLVVNAMHADNGPGLAETSEKIFDPFYSTKKSEQGMGLGLSIVKYFVDEHDGSIEVANNESGGATISVTFPEHPAEER